MVVWEISAVFFAGSSAFVSSGSLRSACLMMMALIAALSVDADHFRMGVVFRR